MAHDDAEPTIATNVDDVDRHDPRPGPLADDRVVPGSPPPTPAGGPEELEIATEAAPYTSERLPPVQGISKSGADDPT